MDNPIVIQTDWNKHSYEILLTKYYEGKVDKIVRCSDDSIKTKERAFELRFKKYKYKISEVQMRAYISNLLNSKYKNFVERNIYVIKYQSKYLNRTMSLYSINITEQLYSLIIQEGLDYIDFKQYFNEVFSETEFNKTMKDKELKELYETAIKSL